MIKKLSYIFCFCLMLPGNSVTQTSFLKEPGIFPYVVTNYNAKQGLPQNQVLDVVPSENGMIVSTVNGIALFDGSFFQSVPDIGKENQFKMLYRLFYDKAAKKLYGWAQDGAYSRIYPKFETLSIYSCISSYENKITGIQPDGVIKTFSYDGQTSYEVFPSGITDPIAVLSHDNYYYVSDKTHLYQIDKQTGKKIILLDGRFELLKINPYNNEVCAVNGDLFCVGEKKIRKIPLVTTETTQIMFRDIEFLSLTEFLVTSSVGLYHINDGFSSLYGMKEGLVSASLYGIYQYKSENCIFVGTENNGLMVLIPKKTKTYFVKDKNSGSQSFTSVIQDESGAIYSSASRGQIIQIKNGNRKEYLSTDAHILSLAYIDKTFYIGTWGNRMILHRNDKQINSVDFSLLPSIHVHSCFKDSKGDLWFGTGKGGIIKTTSGNWKSLDVTKKAVISIYEMKNGNICLGTIEGVFILDKNGNLLRHINEKQGLKCREVRAFYEDSDDKLWIGTYGGGLYCYYNNQLISVNNKPNCQLNKDVFTLVKRPDGKLYMSSNDGIWSVSEKKLNDFCLDKIPYLIPSYYGKEAGIINTEFNGGFQNNYLQTRDKIYFPSIYGLVELTVGNNLPYRKLTPKFKSIIVNDTISPLTTTFARTTHTIRFDFYCPSFVEQYNVHYQYKIVGEGHPDTWSKPQKESTVSLKMLPPGDYTFSIRGIDSFNDADPEVLSYNFIIKPFFYETIWFKISLGLFIGFVVFLLVRFRIRKEAEKNKIMNTIMELKLKAVQSRMNPHFIFNSLNSIIYLLNTEKYEEAEQLLQDFSLLLRRFLEKSDSSFITIEEELEIIRLYLAIQQKRYNYSFEYRVECSPDLLQTNIPSMLVQPFVENAIIHGIAHSNVPCVISVVVLQEENKLKIQIEDNGIGREKSEEINKGRIKHVSHGIQLVKEKIDVMRQKHGIIIDFTVEDFTENSTGTLVTINIYR